MAVVQSTYAAAFAKGYPGMIANGETSNRISRTVEGGALAFGAPAFRGEGDHGVAATGTAFLGFAIGTYAPAGDPTGVQVDAYPEGSTAAILTQGVMWVTATEAAVAGADVADAPGWTYDDTAESGSLVRIAKR